MKNLTLRIDENVLAEARRRAADEGTTVACAVREFLARFAGGDGETDDQRRARMALVDLAERSQSRISDWTWNRENIYADRLSRYERHSLRGAAAEGDPEESGDRAGFAEDD